MMKGDRGVMNRIATWGVFGLLAMLGTGCVADDRYREILNQNDMLQKTNAGLTTENARIKGDLDDLKLLHAHAELDAAREGEARMATQVAFERLSEQIARGGMEGVKVVDGKIQLEGEVFFETGKAEIRKQAEETLKRLAETLKGHVIRVDGHTDDQPVVASKETYPTNWHLCGARALNVLLFLEANGLDPQSLSFSGYGEYQPHEPNAAGHKGNKKNRRVEISVLK